MPRANAPNSATFELTPARTRRGGPTIGYTGCCHPDLSLPAFEPSIRQTMRADRPIWGPVSSAGLPTRARGDRSRNIIVDTTEVTGGFAVRKPAPPTVIVTAAPDLAAATMKCHHRFTTSDGMPPRESDLDWYPLGTRRIRCESRHEARGRFSRMRTHFLSTCCCRYSPDARGGLISEDSMTSMTCTIKRLVSNKGFGCILASDGNEYFFHNSACAETWFDDLREGQAVTSIEDKVRRVHGGRTSD